MSKTKVLKKLKISLCFVAAALLLNISPGLLNEARAEQSTIVAFEISTFARHLGIRPHTAIDFSQTSGEYCFNVNLGAGGHMTHYAIDPTKTTEDVIDFVAAAPLIEVGLDVDKLPRHPGTLGSMKPNQWYYLPTGAFESHHGRKFPIPLLLKATNLD